MPRSSSSRGTGTSSRLHRRGGAKLAAFEMSAPPLARSTLLAILVFGAVPSACEPVQDPPRPSPPTLADDDLDIGPIPIGECASLSGTERDRALAFHRGLSLALEERNARGGIGGHPLELRTLDDRGHADEARRAAERFRAQGDVVALAGGTSCATAQAIAVARQGLAFVTPCAELEQREGVLPLAGSGANSALLLVLPLGLNWSEHYGREPITDDAELGWKAGLALIHALAQTPTFSAKDLSAVLARAR